ncbi:MAG: hypothetical protein ACLTTF_09610 [Oscillospiraceae bacterium]
MSRGRGGLTGAFGGAGCCRFPGRSAGCRRDFGGSGAADGSGSGCFREAEFTHTDFRRVSGMADDSGERVSQRGRTGADEASASEGAKDLPGFRQRESSERGRLRGGERTPAISSRFENSGQSLLPLGGTLVPSGFD